MSYHANRGANNLPQEVRDAIPTMGVLSHWSPRGHGYGAGWSARTHPPMSSGRETHSL